METISIGQTDHEIEVKPITLICKGADVLDDVQYKNRIPIDLEASLYHIDRCKTFHAETETLLRMVFKDFKGPLSQEWIAAQGLGFRHCAGRFDLTLKMLDKGIPIAWVYPEAGLHPAAQVELGDVAIYLINRGNDS